MCLNIQYLTYILPTIYHGSLHPKSPVDQPVRPAYVTLSVKSSLILGENKAAFRREGHILLHRGGGYIKTRGSEWSTATLCKWHKKHMRSSWSRCVLITISYHCELYIAALLKIPDIRLGVNLSLQGLYQLLLGIVLLAIAGTCHGKPSVIPVYSTSLGHSQ